MCLELQGMSAHLHIEEGAQQEAEDVEGGQDLAEDVVHASGVENLKPAHWPSASIPAGCILHRAQHRTSPPAKEEHHQSRCIGLDAVCLEKTMARLQSSVRDAGCHVEHFDCFFRCATRLVDGHVALGGDGPLEALAGHEKLQERFKGSEGGDCLPCLWRSLRPGLVNTGQPTRLDVIVQLSQRTIELRQAEPPARDRPSIRQTSDCRCVFECSTALSCFQACRACRKPSLQLPRKRSMILHDSIYNRSKDLQVDHNQWA